MNGLGLVEGRFRLGNGVGLEVWMLRVLDVSFSAVGL